MEIFTLVLIALALAMDAFAVSVSNGMCYEGLKKRDILKIAMTFGLFQALMPVMGFFLGQTFAGFISKIDHWVAFILLFIVGAHMIIEAIKQFRDKTETCKVAVCTNKSILVQGVATSIDAFAVGVGFALIEMNILLAAILIGTITFACSLIGIWLGRKVKSFVSEYAEIIGGLILIGIGTKILVEGLL